MIAGAQRRICVIARVGRKPEDRAFQVPRNASPPRAKDSTLKCPAFGLCHFSVPSERVSKWAIRAALRTRKAKWGQLWPIRPPTVTADWLRPKRSPTPAVVLGFQGFKPERECPVTETGWLKSQGNRVILNRLAGRP